MNYGQNEVWTLVNLIIISGLTHGPGVDPTQAKVADPVTLWPEYTEPQGICRVYNTLVSLILLHYNINTYLLLVDFSAMRNVCGSLCFVRFLVFLCSSTSLFLTKSTAKWANKPMFTYYMLINGGNLKEKLSVVDSEQNKQLLFTPIWKQCSMPQFCSLEIERYDDCCS